MAPQGWKWLNGEWFNEGVLADPSAQERGTAWSLDLNEMLLKNYCWMDGSGDVLTMRPVLGASKVVRPDGAPVRDGLTEVPYGWRAELEGGQLDGVVLRLMDLQGDKVPEALDDFLAPGLALIYTFDSASVPTTGEWIPKRIAFGGIADQCDFLIQADETNNPEIEQLKWVPGSIAIYHSTKRHNQGFRKYSTGKIAHLPRPLLVGRNANGITGYAFGEYRAVAGQPHQFDKVFNMTEILADPSQTITKFGQGVPTSIHVSADIGQTVMGGSKNSSSLDNQYTFSGPSADGYAETMPENGVFTSLTYGTAVPMTTTDAYRMRVGISDAESNTGSSMTTSYRANSRLTRANADSTTPDGAYDWNTRNFSTGPSFASGDKFVFAFAWESNIPDIIGDTDATRAIKYSASGQTNDTLDDGVVLLDAFTNLRMSIYGTYTVSATPPTTTNVAVDDSTPYKGQTITLSGTVTDGDNPTLEVEWVSQPSVPEGNGTDIPISGSSPFSVEADVLTSAYGLGIREIGIRGRSSDGWGALTTVEIDVGLQQPQNVAASGADEAVNVSWDGILGATNMVLTWSTSSPATSGTDIVLANQATSYEHTGRTNGVEYFYAVCGREADLTKGPYSAEVSAVAGAVPSAGALGSTFKKLLQ